MTNRLANAACAWLLAACCIAAASAPRSPASGAQADQARVDAGKRLVADTCQNDHCHGGSARELADIPGLTAARLKKVINDGIPEVGMQSFKDVYTPEQVEQLVAYILSVSAPSTTSGELSGDPAAGRSLFFAANRCADCHRFQGAGGTVGPDLTGVGVKPASELVRRIVMREGHTAARMPTDAYATSYSVKQLLDLVAFLKSTDTTGGVVTLKDVW